MDIFRRVASSSSYQKSTMHLTSYKTDLNKQRVSFCLVKMAAYASLVSLINIMQQIKDHPRLSFAFDNKQIESLAKKICFLLDFIEANSRAEAEAELESQIASAAYNAEDVIESHIVDQIHAKAAVISLLDLQPLIQEMDCMEKKVTEFKQGRESRLTYSMNSNDDLIQPELEEEVSKFQPSTYSNSTTMIGFDDELIQLMEMLVGQGSSRRIIPVNGMGGIGKTTLARNTFENQTIVNHFDIRAWVTVSQTYNAKAILLELLKSCEKKTSDGTNAEDYEIGEKLHKILSGHRYLIILDDVWSVEAWEKIMFYFPENNNGSRIVVTTRLSNMTTYFGSSCLSMSLLDEEKSWKLFHEEACGQQGRTLPPALEKIGKKIAKNCKGLPLSISVIGGLLGKSPMTQEFWENVAENIISVVNSEDAEHSFNILSLSYTHLPAHLKPCFLYMGVYPEDHDIRISRLINLWVAEGFIKPNETESPEEISKSYIMDLIGRNLMIARKWGEAGNLKTCNLHDLLRDVCLRIANKEKFLHVSITGVRRLVFYGNESVDLDALQNATLARSLICGEKWMPSFKLRLLRVLADVNSFETDIISQHVNMRHLSIKNIRGKELFSSIFLLWSLQTLIGPDVTFVAPLKIWEMPQLRHLDFERINLPYPRSGLIQHGSVLRNLQTLKTVVDLRLFEDLCKRIPNVKRLGVLYIDEFYEDYFCLGNLCLLDKLESLNLDFSKLPNRDEVSRSLKLPSSLQKLTLKNSGLGWEDLAVIGCLPNLQVLKLLDNAVDGSEWNPMEGQFLGLKYLKADYCGKLVRWNADWFHFPVLEMLHLHGVHKLEEIPLGVGDIPTLRHISLENCTVSCAISAVNILEEQESQGNEGLRVRIYIARKQDMDRFLGKTEPLSKNVELGKPFFL